MDWFIGQIKLTMRQGLDWFGPGLDNGSSHFDHALGHGPWVTDRVKGHVWVGLA